MKKLTLNLVGDRADVLLNLFAEVNAKPEDAVNCLIDHLVHQALQGTLLIPESMIGYDTFDTANLPQDLDVQVTDVDARLWLANLHLKRKPGPTVQLTEEQVRLADADQEPEEGR